MNVVDIGLAVVTGLGVGLSVVFLGWAAGPAVPQMPAVRSVAVGIMGALLGTPFWWNFVGLDMPIFVAQLSGAVIALDLYMLGIKLASHR